MSSPLFQPLNIHHIQAPNRVFMAPMTRNRANQAGVVQPITAEYYSQRASAGLIFSEATNISEHAIGYPFTPGMYTDEQEAAWKSVVDAVHAAGGRIVLQLFHTGRCSHSSLHPEQGLPVAPSPIGIRSGQVYTYEGPKDYETPRALELDELPGIVAEFRQAIERAQRAGFDGAEIHAANGYLLHQFLQTGTNQRTDSYGGSVENRARLLLETVDAATNTWDAHHIGVRISPGNHFNDMSDAKPAETYSYVVEQLSAKGIAYLHVIDAREGHGLRGDTYNDYTQELRPKFKGVYVVNGAFDKATGEQYIQEGLADAIAYGVPFLANPDLPQRFETNAPLNTPDVSTFYQGGEKGYTDYPFLNPTEANQPA